MEWNFEGFIDSYGIPVFNTPEKPVKDNQGDNIDVGVIEHWENEVEGLKGDQDGLNEFYRQFPRTEEHAFRDETKNSIFNLVKIYEQVDFNEEAKYSALVTKGSFQWQSGIKDSKVEFIPNPNGRFNVSWVPPVHLQNKVILKNGIKYPGNEHRVHLAAIATIYPGLPTVKDLKALYTVSQSLAWKKFLLICFF